MASFVFGGTDLGGTAFDLRCEWLNMHENGGVPMTGYGVAESSTVYFDRGIIEPLSVTFPCRVSGTDHADLIGNIDRIKSVLSPSSAQTLSFAPMYTDRHWLAVWDHRHLELEMINDRACRVEITFLCQPTMVETIP